MDAWKHHEEMPNCWVACLIFRHFLPNFMPDVLQKLAMMQGHVRPSGYSSDEVNPTRAETVSRVCQTWVCWQRYTRGYWQVTYLVTFSFSQLNLE